jgi:amino acid adenylation domain-containing protein
MTRSAFRTSFAQQRLWFLDQFEPGTAAYNLPRAFRITGPLNIDILKQALAAVVRRHASLRTVFDSIRGEPRQVVLSHADVEIPILDLSGLREDAREVEALHVIANEGRKPFDLSHGPLLRCLLVRLSAEQHIFLLVLHHIITDGWSISILFRELTSCYAAFIRGEQPALPSLSVDYAEFAEWQHEQLSGERLQREIEHWKNKLAGAQPVLDLPIDYARPAMAGWHGATDEITLDSTVLARLKALANSESATLFMVALAAFQALLWRYTAQESVLVGTPVAARNEIELENLVGLFVNTLIFRADFSGMLTFRELIRQVRAYALDAYLHQDVPFEKLVEALVPQRSLESHPLFQVMFTFQNIPKQVFQIPGLSIKEIAFEAGIAKFDLSAEVWDNGQFNCQFEYRTDLFEQATMRRMLGHYANLVRAALDNPDCAIAELPMMDEWERTQVLHEWNRTSAEYPRDVTIHQAFEQQAEETPDNTAFLFEGKRWTYRNINVEANRLAHVLVSKGIGPSSLVGVLMERSPEMVVALLGVLKAGAAYVPLDYSSPVDRISLMLEDASVAGVVVQEHLRDRLPDGVRTVVVLDKDEQLRRAPTSNIAGRDSAEQLAYVIFTSGSTGIPKGVQGLHRASMNRFTWMWRNYPFQRGEVCCQKTNLVFVDSIWEIFGPLLAGMPNVIIPQEAVRDPELFLRVLDREHVSRIVLVPSQLRALLEHAPNLQERVPHLTLWTCSGEVLPVELAKRFRTAFPAAKMLNIYGSSEVAADVTCHEISDQDLALSSVPIGRPISNAQIYLVDRCSNPVPAGLRGEIYIGGEGLARGYVNRPELTAERFVANWLAPEQSPRLYRTGDLGRYRSDGVIEYLGRVDSQIKLRGMRIELGEIESVLASHAEVREAVVTVSGEAEQQKLIAYLVMNEGNGLPEAGELRRYLRSKLPEHMVPTSYWQVEKLPLLPSGKVNRAALSGAGGRALVEVQEWAGPRNETEVRLGEIWKELLKVEAVGREQNFFEMGGHSLLVLQMTARIRRMLEVDLPVRAVFEAPTIAALAREVEQAKALGLRAETPTLQRRPRSAVETSREQLLAELETLSPSELQSVLRRVLDGKTPAA